MRKKTTYGPQTAILPIQQQPNDGSTSQGVGGLKLRHSDAVDRKHSKVNIKTIKNISKHGTMHDMLSIIHNRGDLPASQYPKHSKTCNRSMHSPNWPCPCPCLRAQAPGALTGWRDMLEKSYMRNIQI